MTWQDREPVLRRRTMVFDLLVSLNLFDRRVLCSFYGVFVIDTSKEVSSFILDRDRLPFRLHSKCKAFEPLLPLLWPPAAEPLQRAIVAAAWPWSAAWRARPCRLRSPFAKRSPNSFPRMAMEILTGARPCRGFQNLPFGMMWRKWRVNRWVILYIHINRCDSARTA